MAVQTLLQPTTETTRTSSGVGLETGRQPKTHTATCICDFFGLTPEGHFKATATARKIYNWRHYVLYLFRFGAKSVERYGNTAENNYRKVEEELIKLDVCNEDNDEAQKICEEYFDERKEKQNEYREQSHRQRNNMVETLNELLTTYNINTFTEWIKKKIPSKIKEELMINYGMSAQRIRKRIIIDKKIRQHTKMNKFKSIRSISFGIQFSTDV